MKHYKILFNAILVVFVVALSAHSAPGPRIMEKLGRGLVVVKSGSGYYLSWRLFGPEQGTDVAFNVYKGGTKLNATPITTSTNYQDNSGGTGDYTIKPVVGGAEQDAFKPMLVLQNNYLEIPLQAAPGKAIHLGYVGDLDGDGEYEYIVDRVQTNASQFVDAYHRDGRFMWRVDMGPNSTNTDLSLSGPSTISVGHADDETVYDIDCDGKAELLLRGANGMIFGDKKVLNASTNQKDMFIVAVDGPTGAEKGTRCAVPTDLGTWGNITGHFGICYFDGVHPSLLFKGKVTTQHLMDMAFDCTKDCVFSLRWKVNCTPYTPETFPNNHQIRCLDVNGDGYDEEVNGGYCRDKDGKMLWNMGSQGVVHGDRWHIGDLNPDRPGLEGVAIEQNGPSFDAYEYDAKDGTVLHKWGNAGGDLARGTTGDIDPTHKGYEFWGGGSLGIVSTVDYSKITGSNPPMNCRIWWDGDVLSENLNDCNVSKWAYPGMPAGSFTSFTGEGIHSWRDAVPLYGDMFGDWREEFLCENATNTAIRIYMSTIPTEKRIYCLMHDPEYRNSMCEKGYIQSHMVDYYLGDGMSDPPKPNMTYPGGISAIPNTHSTIGLLATAGTATMRVMAGKSYTLPGMSAGAQRSISVYTCSGELVARGTVNGNTVNLGKQFGLSNSMFVVKLDHAGAL